VIRFVTRLPMGGEQDVHRIRLTACAPEYLPSPDRDKEAGEENVKVESKKWLVTPEVWALNQCSGIAEPRDPRVDDEHLPALVNLLAKAAEKGPHPPLTALHRPSVCRVCGYQSLCYQEHRLTPLALCAAPTRAEESK